MARQPTPAWWETKEGFLKALHDNQGSVRAAVRALGGISATTARKYAKQYEVDLENKGGWSTMAGRAPDGAAERPGVSRTGDEATLTLKPTTADVDQVTLGEVETMMRHHGLNPRDWHVKAVTVNKWDGPAAGGDVQTYRQLKAHLIRLRALPLIVRPGGAVKPIAPGRPLPTRGQILVGFFSCAQNPYRDEALHEASCRWLATNKPDWWFDLGDGGDYPTISRHRDNPAFSAGVQECLNAEYRMQRQRVLASPLSRRTKLIGNHEERLRNELLTRAERVYGIKQAWDDEVDVEPDYEALSYGYLLRLDELGMEYVATPQGGAYEQTYVALTEDLEARHGHWTGPGAVRQALEKVGRSVVMGHTHHQSIQTVTKWRGGERFDYVGMEVGCMCVTVGGLGYAVNPDWQPGFGTAYLNEDGSFSFQLARWLPHSRREGGYLVWGDQEFEV